MFASRSNYRMKPFCAWKPDPEAQCIDAFMQDWSQYELIYIFPPFVILPMVLQKFECEGREAVIIVPFWATKPWFTKLADMLIEEPVMLNSDLQVLFLCSRVKEHPLSGRMKLLICRCSTDASKQWEFRKKCETQYRRAGGSHRRDCTSVTGNNGRTFVSRGTVIRCNPQWLKR